MPNHVTTQCVITGPDKELERLRTTLIRVPEEDREETLDFNLIIPMPETLKSTTSGGGASLGIEVLTGKPKPCIFAGFGSHSYLDSQWIRDLGITNIDELRAWTEKVRPDDIEAGKAAIAAHRETGFYDWYDWSIANWGTKWNSYNFSMDNDDVPDRLSFRFETAWSFPGPIFEKLARMFPTLRFECTCFDEGWFFAGRGAFNGEPVFEIVEPTDELYEAVYGVAASYEGDYGDSSPTNGA
jgi:Ferredoxin-like domain in Api92-like protein